MSRHEFWEWAGFFSRTLGGLLIASPFVGLAMGWALSNAVAFAMCFSGVALVVFGLFANVFASEGREVE
jgi:intracellular septation protein A